MGNVASSAEAAAQAVLDPPKECPASHQHQSSTVKANANPHPHAVRAGSGGGCPVNHVSDTFKIFFQNGKMFYVLIDV